MKPAQVTPKIKFCGITRLEDALAACELGVDAVGFIFHPPSPRFIELDAACGIAGCLPPFVTRVAVTVNAEEKFLKELAASYCFDAVQFHGDETPDACLNFRGLKRIKAVGIPVPVGEPGPADFSVDAVLLDKRSPKRGGTGEAIDWNEAGRWVQELDCPVILSGGLDASNIEKAVEMVQPYAIDICSGTELEPGIKCQQKMKQMIELCRP